MIIGFIFLSIIISYLFKKYYQEAISFIMGVSIGSILLLVLTILDSSYTYIELIMGLVLLIIGLFIGKMFNTN